jgi:zinc resistance-associated protein
MKKTIIAGLTALALMAPALSLAQEKAPDGATRYERQRLSPADVKALTDARIAALRAGLALTPDQEKNWGPVEQAIRDMAQARQARIEKRRAEGRGGDAIARLRARAEAMTQRAGDLKKLADAAEPLYRTLSDDQKHRLHILVRAMMNRNGGRHHGWHRG